MADFRVGDKKLEQLKVAELRDLLDKRGLSKTGVKVELVKRLTVAMVKEEDVSVELEDGDQEEDALRVHELSGQDFASSSGPDALEGNEEDFRGGKDSLQLEEQEDDFSSFKEASSDVKMDSFTGPSEEEEKSDLLGSEEGVRTKPFVREGTPLQDEKAGNTKKGVALGQDDAEMKDPDAVIDLHVRDAFEMNEDVALREGDQKRSAGAPRDSRSQDGGAGMSSRRHLWVSGTGGSLNKSIAAVDLQDFFSQRGTAVSARIVASKSRYHPAKRYGFVTMKTEEEAEACVQELNMRELMGQKLTVEIAKNPPPSGGVGNAEDEPGEKASGEGSDVNGKNAPGGKENDSLNDSVGKTGDTEHNRSKGGDLSTPGSDPANMGPDRDRRKESPRQRSAEHRGDRRRRGRSRSPRRRSPMRRHSPRPRSPAKNDLRRLVRNVDDSGPYDGRSRGLLPDPVPSSSSRGGHMNRFEGRLEPRADIIVRTTEELFQRELGIQRHEKQLTEQMKALREREMKDKIATIEQERRTRDRERKVMERERELMEREQRDRQLREELERELKHKAMKEKEMIERERKSLERLEKDLREKEARMKSEAEARTRELDTKERDLKEKDRVFQHQKATFDLSTFQSPGQKRPLAPTQSEYDAKRAPVSHALSPYSLPASRVSSSGTAALLNTPHTSWNAGGTRSSTSTSYQTQSTYTADKKTPSSYEPAGSTSHSYSTTTSYSHGRPTSSKQLDNQSASASSSYDQYSTPKSGGGGGLLSKPTNPGSGSGEVQSWRGVSPRSAPSSGGPNRGYGSQQDRSSSSSTYGAVQDRPSPSYSQQQSRGSSGYSQQDRTPSSYSQQQDRTPSSYGQQDRSTSSGYGQSERTSTTYGSQDRPASGGGGYGQQQQDRAASSYSQPERSSPGYGQQDRSSGGGPSHSHMSDNSGGANRSPYSVRGRGRGRGRGGVPPPSGPAQRYDMYPARRY